jgi:hypothetical protein
MEFYKFISDNGISNFEDLKSLLSVEPYFIKVKEDNVLTNLALLHNEVGKSDFNNKIVRICNGIIIEKSTLKIVCYTLEKCEEDNKVSAELDFENDIYIQNCVEGALIRLFNYNNEWVVSTKKCINSSNSKWISQKSFFQLFLEAFPSFTNDKLETLNKNYCYSFILSHPENDIINKRSPPLLYHILTRDMNTLAEINVDIHLPKLSTCLTTRDDFGSLEKMYEYYRVDKNMGCEGFMLIDSKGRRHKIIKDLTKYIRNLWGNNNNRFFRYLELRKDLNLLNEYLFYFGYDKPLFLNYEGVVSQLAHSIFGVYMNKFIMKTSNDVPFFYKKIIYNIHGDFLKTREQITPYKILYFLGLLDPKQICYMLNNLNKVENTNNVPMEL